ncbi:MAG: nucleotidyl transferase AbiEii/AbiGii toxin family protein [Bacilli bacterium]|nr:nucleotidyl transferase AbiEii/AbiGii toxin family protein [Bacilli bacterium]
MKINKQSLQDRINNISRQKGVSANILLKSFFFDGFIKRLSVSDYVNDFIFKGGFFLSKKLGIEYRSTMDIDFLVRKINVEQANIERIVKNICSIDVGDGIRLNVSKTAQIRNDDLYGGINVFIKATFENVVDYISIDIATGDPITPSDVSFVYKTALFNEEIQLRSYNFETVLAEKFQTLLLRGALNSRCKDFYDIHIIYQTRWNEIDNDALCKAFSATCEYRNTIFNANNSEEIIELISNSAVINQRWANYSKKNDFAKGIMFEEIITSIKKVAESIFRPLP